MDLIAEIILELYLGIAEILVPDHKFKKWQEVLLKVLSLLISLAILGLLAAGIALLVEDKQSVLGIALLSVGCGILAVQIVLFIIVIAREIKAQSKKKKLNNMLFSEPDEQ